MQDTVSIQRLDSDGYNTFIECIIKRSDGSVFFDQNPYEVEYEVQLDNQTDPFLSTTVMPIPYPDKSDEILVRFHFQNIQESASGHDIKLNILSVYSEADKASGPWEIQSVIPETSENITFHIDSFNLEEITLTDYSIRFIYYDQVDKNSVILNTQDGILKVGFLEERRDESSSYVMLSSNKKIKPTDLISAQVNNDEFYLESTTKRA